MRLTHVEASEGSLSRERLDLLLRVLFAAFAYLGLVPVALAVRESGSPAIALLPIATSFVAPIIVLVRGPVWIGLATLSVALVTSVGLPVDSLQSGSRIILGFIGFLLVIQHSRQRVARLLLYIVVLYVGLHLVLRSPADFLTAIDDAVLTAALTLTGALFMDVLISTLTRLDHVRSERVRRDLAESFQTAAARAAENSRHLLHNEVIGTLSAIANYRGIDEAGVRDASRRVGDLLAHEVQGPRDVPVTLRGLLSSAAADTMVRLVVTPTDDDPVLDEVEFVALDRAVREALRNVLRHAGVDEADVSWHREAGLWRLELADQGAGSHDVIGSWGVTKSITRSLVEIGGSAQIQSSPGIGTAVILRWPTVTASSSSGDPETGHLRRTHAETVRALGDDTSLALQVAVPVLIGNAWLALRYSWGDPHFVAELALAAIIFAGTLLLVTRLRERPLSGWWLSAVSASAGLAVLAGLRLAEPGALSSYDSWVIGLSAVVLTVSAFYVPFGWALGLVGPSVAVVVVAISGSGQGLGETGGALNAVVVPAVLGNCFGAYLRWIRGVTDNEEARVARAALEAHRVQVERRSGGEHLAHARNVVGPWLRSVAEGATSLQDATTRDEAHRLTVEMRDELHLPGVLDAGLRSRIAVARQRGVVVDLVAPDGDVRGTGPYLRVLDRALDFSELLERIIVDLPNGSRRHGEVVLLPPVDREGLRSVLRCLEGTDHSVLIDMFSTRIVLRSPVFTGCAEDGALL